MEEKLLWIATLAKSKQSFHAAKILCLLSTALITTCKIRESSKLASEAEGQARIPHWSVLHEKIPHLGFSRGLLLSQKSTVSEQIFNLPQCRYSEFVPTRANQGECMTSPNSPPQSDESPDTVRYTPTLDMAKDLIEEGDVFVNFYPLNPTTTLKGDGVALTVFSKYLEQSMSHAGILVRNKSNKGLMVSKIQGSEIHPDTLCRIEVPRSEFSCDENLESMHIFRLPDSLRKNPLFQEKLQKLKLWMGKHLQETSDLTRDERYSVTTLEAQNLKPDRLESLWLERDSLSLYCSELVVTFLKIVTGLYPRNLPKISSVLQRAENLYVKIEGKQAPNFSTLAPEGVIQALETSSNIPQMTRLLLSALIRGLSDVAQGDGLTSTLVRPVLDWKWGDLALPYDIYRMGSEDDVYGLEYQFTIPPYRPRSSISYNH